jgi:hypothetical protein
MVASAMLYAITAGKTLADATVKCLEQEFKRGSLARFPDEDTPSEIPRGAPKRQAPAPSGEDGKPKKRSKLSTKTDAFIVHPFQQVSLS